MASESEGTAGRARAWMEKSGLTAMWRWWTGELGALLPVRIRHLLHPARARLALVESDEGCALHVAGEGGWREVTRWEPAAEEGAPLPKAVTEALGAQGRDIYLILSATAVLRRRVAVPKALEENLRAAMAFELDRYTPFNGEQAYFDARASAYDARGLLEVDLAVAPRVGADRAMERAKSWGFNVVGLLPDLPLEGSEPLDLLPQERREQGHTGPAMALIGLSTLAVVLALTALVLPIWQKRAAVRALEPQVNEARGRAEAAERQHRQLIAEQQAYNFLLTRKHTQPMAVEVLDEVTRILPDDTWAHLVELKSDAKNPGRNRELQVRGETGISGKLISVFEESRLFTQATYKSPVTKGQPGAGDVFHVGAEVKQRVAPEPEAAVAPAAPTPPIASPAVLSPASAPAAPTAGAVAPNPPGPLSPPAAVVPSSAPSRPAPNPRHQVSVQPIKPAGGEPPVPRGEAPPEPPRPQL